MRRMLTGLLLAPAMIVSGCNYTAQQRADLTLTLATAKAIGQDAVQFYCASSGIIYVIANTAAAKSRVAVNLGKNAAIAQAACPLLLNAGIQVITKSEVPVVLPPGAV
jgi:hypothetical protein